MKTPGRKEMSGVHTCPPHPPTRTAGFLELLMQRSMWGNLRGPVRRKLRAVLRDHLAAILSGARAPPFDGYDGENWRAGYLYAAAAVVFGWISDRWIADSCSQNFCACRSGDCRAIPPWLHPRRSHGLCYSAATSVRSRWHVRIQYLGDHTNAGRSENGGPMDGLAEFPRKSCRCQRAGSDRIRNRLHRTFFVAFVIMAFVALLAAVSYVFVIGPVKEIAWEG